MNVFGQKKFLIGQSGCIRAKWLYSGKSACNREKVLVIGQKWFNLGKVVFSGKSACFREKVVLYGQSGCIRAK